MTDENTHFHDLPVELILHATSFLEASSLLRLREVNTYLKEYAASDGAGWKHLCRDLWRNKVFRPQNTDGSMEAYRDSIQDSRDRQHVHLDELLYDIEKQQGTIWSFRFKECAGPDWTSWDPWYNGRPARQMIFLRDGTVRQFIGKDVDPSEDLLLVPNPQAEVVLDEGVVMEPPVTMAWRFCTKPMDLPERPQGSYIRFSVGGRDVPTYCLRRSPTNNWGFVAESCWGVYTSFPMPPKEVNQSAPAPAPAPARHTMRLRRTTSGNRWVHASVNDDNDDDDLSNSAQRHQTPASLLSDDSAFIINNEVQWREALLYNFGATVLPEGDNAADDFDRMFGQHLHRAGPDDSDDDDE